MGITQRAEVSPGRLRTPYVKSLGPDMPPAFLRSQSVCTYIMLYLEGGTQV